MCRQQIYLRLALNGIRVALDQVYGYILNRLLLFICNARKQRCCSGIPSQAPIDAVKPASLARPLAARTLLPEVISLLPASHMTRRSYDLSRKRYKTTNWQIPKSFYTVRHFVVVGHSILNNLCRFAL